MEQLKDKLQWMVLPGLDMCYICSITISRNCCAARGGRGIYNMYVCMCTKIEGFDTERNWIYTQMCPIRSFILYIHNNSIHYHPFSFFIIHTIA